MGLKQPIRSWNLTDRRETAYHEAGHAVAARYLRPSYRISKATIIRRGHALGYVQQKPLEERTSLYARWIETQIMVSLAGHVVENRFLDTLSTGPSSDLQARHQRGRPTTSSQFGDGPDEAHRPDAAGPVPAGSVRRRRARDARRAVRGDRAASAREGAGHPPPGEGADRARRADRRRARGGVRRGRASASRATRQVRRKIIPFRDFAPPERQVPGEGFFPQPVAQEAAAEPAASSPGSPGSLEAASAVAEAQVAGWLPPGEGSARDRNRRSRGPGEPGMPTDVIPPWATTRH